MVSLKLYNTVGQLVQEIVQSDLSAGMYTFDVDTRGLAQGTYFFTLETPCSTVSRSLVVLR
jgi:hypothetical protein